MRPLITICLFLVSQISWAQSNNQQDSLINALKNCKTDTGKITIISKIVTGYYYHSAYDQIIDFATVGLELSKETGDKKHEAAFYVWLGVAHHYKGSYELELQNYLLALKIDEEIGNKKGISGILSNIGSIYYENMKDYDKALDY